MTLEEKLAGWTGPSSDTEQDKQERTERMVREAMGVHPGFAGCNLNVYTKGSYPNNTNVRTDSDVDVGVQCHEARYSDEHTAGARPAISPYQGIWTPTKLRSEVEAALKAKFPNQVDTSGSTAIRVKSSTARVDADVVPCFDYRYYFSADSYRDGAKTFRKSGPQVVNYPTQHLASGRAKNNATNGNFKKSVRILKRAENAMLAAGVHRAVQSYFIECLVFNCPNSVFEARTWVDMTRQILVHLWNGLEGPEPSESNSRWLEVSRCKYLFHNAQPWTRQDGRDLAKAAWNYLGLGS